MRYEKPFISLESLDDRLIEQGLSADRDDLMEEDLRRMGFTDGCEQRPMWRSWTAVTEHKSEKGCLEFNSETLSAMDDAVTGRNLYGPYHTVKEAIAALDEE